MKTIISITLILFTICTKGQNINSENFGKELEGTWLALPVDKNWKSIASQDKNKPFPDTIRIEKNGMIKRTGKYGNKSFTSIEVWTYNDISKIISHKYQLNKVLTKDLELGRVELINKNEIRLVSTTVGFDEETEREVTSVDRTLYKRIK